MSATARSAAASQNECCPFLARPPPMFPLQPLSRLSEHRPVHTHNGTVSTSRTHNPSAVWKVRASKSYLRGSQGSSLMQALQILLELGNQGVLMGLFLLQFLNSFLGLVCRSTRHRNLTLHLLVVCFNLLECSSLPALTQYCVGRCSATNCGRRLEALRLA